MGKPGRPGPSLDDYLYWQESLQNREASSLSIDEFCVAEGALEALLPDRWLADHPEHRLEQREEESREAQARRRRKRVARRIAATQ